jgi:hypothetical protein
LKLNVSRVALVAGTTVWLAGITWGLSVVWAYENRPGAAAHAPVRWPAQTPLAAATDRPTLVFLAHPQCTCTRASLDELTQVLARAPRPPKTYILFLRPAVFEAGWEKTELWRAATALPNVTLLRDDDGVEARRFGVETSGQTLLYDRRGTLIFSGGITGSRGHGGMNDGEAALLDLLTGRTADRHVSNVFGCPLFDAP